MVPCEAVLFAAAPSNIQMSILAENRHSRFEDDDEFFEDYVKSAINDVPPSLPEPYQRIGNSDAVWFECEPGVAFISTTGGSPDDRLLAELVVKNQLKGHGYRQAQYTFESTERTATWDDEPIVMERS